MIVSWKVNRVLHQECMASTTHVSFFFCLGVLLSQQSTVAGIMEHRRKQSNTEGKPLATFFQPSCFSYSTVSLHGQRNSSKWPEWTKLGFAPLFFKTKRLPSEQEHFNTMIFLSFMAIYPWFQKDLIIHQWYFYNTFDQFLYYPLKKETWTQI